MNIGIAVWDLTISGGTQRQALELSRELQRRGHDVTVFAYYFDDHECYPDIVPELSVESVHDNARDDTWLLRKWPIRRITTLKRSRELASLIPCDLDVLNCHAQIVYLAGVFNHDRNDTPFVWTMNDLPFSPSQDSGLKRVVRRTVDNPFFLRWHRSAIDNAADVVVLDRRNQERLRSNFDRDSTIVRGGLNVDDFLYEERRQPPDPNDLTLLAVGIFFPHRRYEDLIRALRILVDRGHSPSLKIVGTERRAPDYARRVRNLVEEYDLSDHVDFLGRVSDHDLKRLYRHSDIFVFPNAPQTWGLAVFEAMASGTPVVTTDGCGASEVLKHERNAIVTNKMDPSALANGIERILQDSDLWRNLSEEGQEFVREHITWERYAEDMTEIYRKTITT